jgi:hypothetical protein
MQASLVPEQLELQEGEEEEEEEAGDGLGADADKLGLIDRFGSDYGAMDDGSDDDVMDDGSDDDAAEDDGDEETEGFRKTQPRVSAPRRGSVGDRSFSPPEPVILPESSPMYLPVLTGAAVCGSGRGGRGRRGAGLHLVQGRGGTRGPAGLCGAEGFPEGGCAPRRAGLGAWGLAWTAPPARRRQGWGRSGAAALRARAGRERRAGRGVKVPPRAPGCRRSPAAQRPKV